MNRVPFAMTTLALAASLAACGGGGDASAPRDLTPPTVNITDNVAAATATGPVTFTFSFSEAVTGFTADDVSVTNGSKGSFSMASDALSATLVVTPTASTSGTLTVSVATGAFSDASGNANAAGASATQDFNTVVSGDTGTCTAAPCINFSEATVGFATFEGMLAEVVNDPVSATNKVAKFTKPVGAQPWAGATVHLGAGDLSVAAVDPATGITLRVYSPAVGLKVMVKIEDAANGAVFVEADALTTKAGEWETLSFSYPSASAVATYNKVSVFPSFFEVGGPAAAERVFYIDELKYTEKAVTPPLVFASNFGGVGGTTDLGGSWGGYSGGDQDGYNCTNSNSFCGSGLNDVKDRVFYYYVAPLTTTALYSGLYVMAPGITAPLSGNLSGMNVSTKSTFSFTFSQNPEWFNSTEKNFGVLFTMSQEYVPVPGQQCRIQLWQVVTPTSADDTLYSINLSGFRMLQDCASGLTVTQALAQQTIAQIDFKANIGGTRFPAADGQLREGANLQNRNGDNLYPTTLVVKGPLRFQ
jgi:hypothetical protein